MSIEQKSMSPRAWAELGLLALIWGGSFLCNALALRDIGPVTIVAFRIAGAALVLWAFVLWRGFSVPRSPRIWLDFAVMGLVNNVLPFTLITWGQQHVPSGLAAILNGSTAIFGVLIAAIVFSDEQLTRRKTTGVALGFAGMAVVIGPDALRGLDLTSIGQLALIGAAICYGLSGTWARARLSSMTPQVAAMGMLTASTVMIVPLAIWAEGLPGAAAINAGFSLFYLAVIATAAAYLLYYRVLAMAGTGNLLLVTLLVAPVAVVLGALILDEQLGWRAGAGFALLALGLAVIDGRLLKHLRV